MPAIRNTPPVLAPLSFRHTVPSDAWLLELILSTYQETPSNNHSTYYSAFTCAPPDVSSLTYVARLPSPTTFLSDLESQSLKIGSQCLRFETIFRTSLSGNVVCTCAMNKCSDIPSLFAENLAPSNSFFEKLIGSANASMSAYTAPNDSEFLCTIYTSLSFLHDIFSQWFHTWFTVHARWNTPNWKICFKLAAFYTVIRR